VRATGSILLGLGFAASAVAVVPGFERLLHGDKTYLVVTALLGLAALAGAVQMLVSTSGAGMAVMMAAMVVLWAIATTHHILLANAGQPTDHRRMVRHGS
jgi:steroid 5-alpha reductase family enzyme